MSMVTTVAVLLGALAVFTASAVYIVGALRRSPTRPKPSQDPTASLLETLAARVAAVEVTVAGLPSLWAEEARRAKNDRKSADAIRRDQEKRAARVGDEATDGVVPEEHGVGSGASELRVLPSSVADRTEDQIRATAFKVLGY